MYATRIPMDHRVCQELFIDTSMEYELDYTKFPELLDSRYMYEPMLRIVSKLDDSPLSSTTERSSVSVDSHQADPNRNFHKSVPDHTSWISESEINSRCLCLGEYCLCDSDISDEALLALMDSSDFNSLAEDDIFNAILSLEEHPKQRQCPSESQKENVVPSLKQRHLTNEINSSRPSSSCANDTRTTKDAKDGRVVTQTVPNFQDHQRIGNLSEITTPPRGDGFKYRKHSAGPLKRVERNNQLETSRGIMRHVSQTGNILSRTRADKTDNKLDAMHSLKRKHPEDSNLYNDHKRFCTQDFSVSNGYNYGALISAFDMHDLAWTHYVSYNRDPIRRFS